MDHNSYHHCCEPFNWHPQTQHPPTPASELSFPFPNYDTPTPAAPGSPSDFIYNSSANATGSIFRPSPPSHPSLFSVPSESASTPTYPSGAMGYGPSRPVEQSFPTYLPSLPEPSLPEPSLPEQGLPKPSLPEPTPGFEEHRRERQRRQSAMNMGPGPSKLVPPALSLGGERGSNRGSNRGSGSSESAVVIKQEEVLSSPVLVSVPSIPSEPRVKKWEPRMPTEPQGMMEQVKVEAGPGKGKEMSFGNAAGLENDIGSGRGSDTWEERGGEGVMERVMMMPPVVPSMGTTMGMGMGMEPGIERDMGMGMGMEARIMPKMGLFKPIRWDGPSSSSASRSSKTRTRRARAWEVETVEEGGNDVPLQRTYGTQNQNRNKNRNKNKNKNDETEDEQQSSNAPISSSFSHPRSPKRLKTSLPSGPCTFCSASASASAETETETVTPVKIIKQEPGLSPSPSAIFAQIPMYNNGTIYKNTGNGLYESPDHDDDNPPPSSRSISPLTRIPPTPRRLLFPTPNRTSSTGTNSQLSLRGVSCKQLKKRNRQMASALDREESGEQSREESRERRGEGFWSLAGGGGGGSQAQGRNTTAAQDEEIREWASPRQQQQQQQYRGSSEEKEEGWTTISGSSEEGEVSSHYENSYSCGQERNDAPRNTHQSSSPFIPYADQEWCRHPFSSTSTSPAPVPGSSSSARYGPGSEPSLSASQERVEQYRQAIQMVQDTCLEATKRYIRAHCVNRGARGGGTSNTTSPVPRETVETRSAARKQRRRKRKLKARRHASPSSSSTSSSSSSSSPSPPPSRRRRRRKNRKRTTTTTTPPFFSPSSPNSPQAHNDIIPCTTDSLLLPNISQICTLLWSRSQSLRLHDIDSTELHTARNMYWLLEWAETVAFAVAPTPTVPDSTSGTSVGSSFPGFGVSSLENLAESGRGQWTRPSASFARRERDPEHAISPWENFGEGLNEEGYMWRRRNSVGFGGLEVLESRNGAVWEQQREEMKRVFDEGGMLCEFLGYGEGVERLGRVRGFYGF